MNRVLERDIKTHDLKQWRNWTGASKDVITIAWSPSPESRFFAIGTSTELNTLNIQYNRPNNLLCGDLDRNLLLELDAHHTDRPRPEEIADEENPNALDGTYNALDPCLFTTVSAISFDQEGRYMFTGSYDRTVKVWDASQTSRPPKCIQTLEHSKTVELLDLNESGSSKVLATAQSARSNGISIFNIDTNCHCSLAARISSERNADLYPTALKWGSLPSHTDHLLLAGFAENEYNSLDRDRQGDLLVWDVNEEAPLIRLSPSSQSVFDVIWHHRLPFCAAATTPGTLLTHRKKTSSVVRTFRPLHKPSRVIEYECPALDINEIKFHPSDDNYVTAACTDGKTYLWDARRPDQVLNCFAHDLSIEELSHERSREEADTGVRFMAWNPDGTHLYTGSSDGVLKCWSPSLAPEDSLVRNVASFDSAIMSGAFSPDMTHLIIGLCKGAVHVLSSASWQDSIETGGGIRYISALNGGDSAIKREREDCDPDSALKRQRRDESQVTSTELAASQSRMDLDYADADEVTNTELGISFATTQWSFTQTGIRLGVDDDATSVATTCSLSSRSGSIHSEPFQETLLEEATAGDRESVAIYREREMRDLKSLGGRFKRDLQPLSGQSNGEVLTGIDDYDQGESGDDYAQVPERTGVSGRAGISDTARVSERIRTSEKEGASARAGVSERVEFSTRAGVSRTGLRFSMSFDELAKSVARRERAQALTTIWQEVKRPPPKGYLREEKRAKVRRQAKRAERKGRLIVID